MAFDIKQHAPVDRPVIASGRGADSNLPALKEEVAPLIDEAVKLDSDKALPLVVPIEQATDLVRALRAVGEDRNLTVRFKRFPRIGEDGERETKTVGDGDKQRTVPVTDPFEFTNRSKSSVRVTFWTVKKITKQRKAKTN